MNNIRHIELDIGKICKSLEEDVNGISIFGSFLGKSYENINDIDIVVFVEKNNKKK